MQRSRPQAVTLDDILITEELSRRSPHPPNWQAEAQAMQLLARQMARNSETLRQTLADIALELCQAGTAGVSELTTTPNGEEIFRWSVIAGTLAQYVGGSTPLNSPCGVCLDRGTPQLFSHPELYFTYFQAANTPVVESLVLPLVADNQALGTIWIMSHDEQRHFDSEDVRVMTSLADFTAAFILKQQQTRELLAANATLETEIAERKQTEAQLGNAQRRLELSLRGADLGTWTYHVGTDDFWADDRALQMHGHEPDEVHTFAEAGANIHSEDRDRAQAEFAQVIQDRSKLQIEYRVVGKDGSVRWIASYAEYVSIGDRDDGMFYGIAQDITAAKRDEEEREQAEAALRESEARLQVMIENLPGGAVFVVDRDLRYLLAEGKALHAANFNPEDLVGKTIFEAMPPELTTQYEKLYRQALAGEPFEYEHNAHDRSYISRGTPLRSANGDVYAVLAVSYDITDRKRHEQHQSMLSEISQELVGLDNVAETMNSLGEKIGQSFGVKQCVFAELTEDFEISMAAYGWNAEGSHSLKGTYRTRDFLTDEQIAAQMAGEVSIVGDTQTDPRVSAESYGALDIRSFVIVPLVRDRLWRFMLAIIDNKPRQWHEDEVDLMREITSRIWARLERARAEEAVRQSEAKYRSLFENVNDGFCIIEMLYDDGQPIDYRFLEVNPAFEIQSGFKHAIGKTARELASNLEAVFLTNYETVLTTGEPIEFEIQPADVERYFRVAAYRHGEPHNKQLAILFSDITDRKRAEAQLRRTAELDAFRVKLSDALRSLTDPVEIQTQACRLLGEHLGVDRAYHVEVNEAKRYARVNQNYLRGDSPTLVGVFRLADYGWTVPLLQRGETIIVADADNSDIIPTADREAMAAVRIAAHISTPLVKAGALAGALCVTESQPRQWSPTEIELVRETAERIWAAIERARAETALRESEFQRIREQAAREEERQRAETLAELDRAKTLFFSNVSHEFRTPLTLLLAPLQDALSDRTHPLAPPQRERLELVQRNATRLLKLVNTLLDFSRIEAGRMEAVYEPTNLAMLTTELASVFRSAIERAGLRLVVDCPPLPESVYVDRSMWEKIVLNLLSNAFKFTLEGEIAVRLHSADGRVVLQIQDTGTGIALENLPHLFERFYQVRGTQARTHEGSGIGLSLVQELIRMHGGTVEVSSTVGQGTCFTVTIPLGTEHLPSDRLRLDVGDRNTTTRNIASTAIGAAPYVEEAGRWLPVEAEERNSLFSPAPLLPCSPASSARILLVDDNADMRDYLTRILSEYVQVEAVADGAAALATAQARVPDLVLSDIMMPELDGFGLLKALRADPQTREIPIILLSARAGEEAVVEGLAAGADDYLIKPFSAAELVSRVNAHLQMTQLRSQALRQEKTTSRRKDELLSTVSHELNTPLVAILGWTRLLRANPPSPSVLMKSLETIERNATLQAGLIQDLLDISRIEAGKLRFSLQPVELKSVIEMATATVSQMAEAKHVHLVWRAMTGQASAAMQQIDSVVVMGDRDRLQQIVCNLLTNAVKFTPESGSVVVELSVAEAESASDKSSAQIRIADTGIGISAEFLPHVFDRFRQAKESDSTKGLGLGLAIARHLVELHNGTIYAQSAGVGQGATFTVRLPLVMITKET